jgi:hypothetical protein
MIYSWEIDKNSLFYCKECNRIYSKCYELENICMCTRCFSEEIQPLSEKEIQPFIRKKRLQKLKEISELS